MTAYEPLQRGTRDASTQPPDTRPQGLAAAAPLFVGPLDEPDRYELSGQGTRGGEGVTWQARYVGRLQTPITVAVKLLRRPDGADLDWPTPADQQRWRDHRALLSHLEIPHLVRLHDVFAGPAPHQAFEVDGGVGGAGGAGRSGVLGGGAVRADCAYLVMEWVDGPTLDAVVRATPPSALTAQRLAERLTVVQQLCQASQALRSRTRSAGNPLLHRDIKPSNCIVHPVRGAVLIDVTTARGLGDGHDPLGLATVQYCAPEVLAAPTQPRQYPGEVYALGAVAAFCVLGADPPHIASPTALLALEQELRAAAEAAGVRDAAGLARELGRALHPDPLRRPDDTITWSENLLRTITQADPLAAPRDPFRADGDGGGGADDVDRARGAGRPKGRGRVLLAAAIALAVVVGAVGVFLATRGPDPGRGGAVAPGTTAAPTGAPGSPGALGAPAASGAASGSAVLQSPLASVDTATNPAGSSPTGSATATTPSASARVSPSASPSRRPSSTASPAATRATASPRVSSPAPQTSVTVEAAASGRITDPGPGGDVQQCYDFSGTATLPPGTTLVLVMHPLENGDSQSYAENVYNWTQPQPSWSWRGPQYFAYGGESSVGYHYRVTLAAAPLGDVAAQLNSTAVVRANELAKVWTVLDAVTVTRIAGVPNTGCQF